MNFGTEKELFIITFNKGILVCIKKQLSESLVFAF